MAKIRRIYNPLDIAVTVSAIESSLRQDYDVNYKRFTPDRRLVPTVVQPIVTLRDSAGLVDDGVINSKLIPESIKYYRTYYDAVLGKSVRKEITNDINYTIDTTSNSDNRGRITIRQNFIQENTTTITFQATYIDYVNVGGTNKERRRASVSESFTLTTDTLSQPEPLLIVDTPIGISYNPLKDLKWLNMVADLRVGQESIPSAYWWYKKDGAVETLLGEKYVGHNKRDIRIPSYEIGNKQDYVVKVQDCRNELEQLKNDYIDTEIAKNIITTSDGDIVLNNEAKNGNFENGLIGSFSRFDSSTGESTLVINSSTPISGNYDIRFTIITPMSNLRPGFYGLDKGATTGDKIYLHFYAKILSGTPVISGIHNGASTFPISDGHVINGRNTRVIDVAGTGGNLGLIYFDSSSVWDMQMDNFMRINLTETFGAGNEPTVEQMDAYLADNPFITNTEDVRAEADKLTLPEGYRPAPVTAKQKTAQLTLATQYPEYDVRVVTDYGDDATVIEIPSNVYKFEAWVEIHTASGLLRNPEKYFDIDWGNDVNGNPQIGQKITVFSELLGLGIYNLEPTVTERVLNSSIAGKQTVVGARIIHLSEYADERPIPFNLKGLTATNLIENGDFRDGTTGWISSNATKLAVANGIASFTATAQYGKILRPYSAPIGSIMYMRARVKGSANIAVGTQSGLGSTRLNGTGSFEVISQRQEIDRQSTVLTIQDNSISGWSKVDVDFGFVINLTETFGAGNEPTKEECDKIFGGYFEGTQSVDAPVRVKSVGKNLFDKSRVGIGGIQVPSGNVNTSFDNYRYTDYIPVIGGSQYRQNADTAGSPAVGGAFYDSNKLFISGATVTGSSSRTITVPSAAKYVRTCWFVNQKSIDEFQIEKGTTETVYEPYKETNLYIDNNTKLRSLPNGVKDEIRPDGKGGYELVKRVGVGTLGSELITNAADREFSSDTGWWKKNLNAVIANGVASVSNATGSSAGVNKSELLTLNKSYRIDFEIKSITSGGLRISIGTPMLRTFFAVGKYTYYGTCTGDTTLRIYGDTEGQSFEIDNVSVKEVIPQDGAISGTSTFTGLSDVTILYTLGTPVITPLNTSGSLISRPSGTVYIENAVANAGVYTDKFSVMDVDLEIKALESIAKIDYQTGEATQLNVSKAVLGDTFFTHPDLEDKDIVYVNYVYKHSNVYGEASVEYYNVID